MANNTNIASTWRELLGSLTRNRQQREQIAQELGVNPYTIVRWVNGETTPRTSYLKRLPSLFPGYEQQFEELLQADLFPPPLPDTVLAKRFAIPTEYLLEVLRAYATLTGPSRPWMLRYMILSQALEVLDPDESGISIVFLHCIPPIEGGGVRSLCKRMETGTPPWDTGINVHLVLVGAESLAGWSVSQGAPGIVQDIEQGRGVFPLWPAPNKRAMSIVAYPIRRASKVAGSLVICSVVRHYFTSERLRLIEAYANTLALSFDDHEFYETSQIKLWKVPLLSPDQWLAYGQRFNEEAQELRKSNTLALSPTEIEAIALQRIETAILDGRRLLERE